VWAAGGRRRRAHDDSCVPEPWPSRGATPRSLSVPRGCCGFPCAPAALPGLAGTVSSRTNKPRRQRRAEARLATAAQRSCAYGARAVGDAAPVGNEKGQIFYRYQLFTILPLSQQDEAQVDGQRRCCCCSARVGAHAVSLALISTAAAPPAFRWSRGRRREQGS
jgi:hypothetical protein